MKSAAIKTLSLLLAVCMVLLCAPVVAFADTTVEFQVFPDVTEAQPGDKITYTVYIGPVMFLSGLQVRLGIPEGLTFGQCETETDFLTNVGANNPQFDSRFNTATLTYIIYSDDPNFNYASDESVVLLTFTCKVDADAAGEKTIGLDIMIADRIAYTLPTGGYDPAGSAVTVIAPLSAAKADAKTELENYKNADDYRAAQKTELANAIAAGKDAIDAAADIDAVAAALAAAKTVIDAIKTNAQLTAEEQLAADKASFDAYKLDRIAAVQAMAQDDDSAAAAEIIANAASGIALLGYDATKTLDDNKAAVDALADIAGALAAQRAADFQLFLEKHTAYDILDNYKNPDDYRDEQKTELADMLNMGKAYIDVAADIDAVAAALTDAKALLDAIKTDAQLTAEEAAAAQLADAKADTKAALANYKNAADYRAAEQADLADAISSGDAAIDAAADIDAVAAALTDAKTAIDAIKTDAQLTAEEAAAALAADKAAFEDYKAEQKAAAQAMAEEGDSIASAQLIADAVAAVEAMKYSEARTLEQNKALVDTVLAKLANDLAAQRAAEAAAVVRPNTKICPFCGENHGITITGTMIALLHHFIYFVTSLSRSLLGL